MSSRSASESICGGHRVQLAHEAVLSGKSSVAINGR